MAATKYVIFCRYINDRIGKVITNSTPVKWIPAEYFNDLKRIFYTYRRNYMYLSGGNIIAKYEDKTKSPAYTIEQRKTGNNGKITYYAGERITGSETLPKYYYDKCNEYANIVDCFNDESDNSYALEYCDIRSYNFDPNSDSDPIESESDDTVKKNEIKRRSLIDKRFNNILMKENNIDNPKYDMIFMYEGLSHYEFLGWEVYNNSGDKVLYDFDNNSCKVAVPDGTKASGKTKYKTEFVTDGVLAKPYRDTYINQMRNITYIRDFGSNAEDYNILYGSYYKSSNIIVDGPSPYIGPDKDVNGNSMINLTSTKYKYQESKQGSDGKPTAVTKYETVYTTKNGRVVSVIDDPDKSKNELASSYIDGIVDKPNILMYPYLRFNNPILYNIRCNEKTGEFEEKNTTTEVNPEIYFDKMKRLSVQPWCQFCTCNSLRTAMEKVAELSKIMETKNIKVGKEVPLEQYIDIV